MRWMKLETIIPSEVSQKRNTNTVYYRIYMEFRKTITMTLYERQQKRHRCKEQILDYVGKGRVGRFERIAMNHVYYHM